jgi:hypothetical protein
LQADQGAQANVTTNELEKKVLGLEKDLSAERKSITQLQMALSVASQQLNDWAARNPNSALTRLHQEVALNNAAIAEWELECHSLRGQLDVLLHGVPHMEVDPTYLPQRWAIVLGMLRVWRPFVAKVSNHVNSAPAVAVVALAVRDMFVFIEEACERRKLSSDDWLLVTQWSRTIHTCLSAPDTRVILQAFVKAQLRPFQVTVHQGTIRVARRTLTQADCLSLSDVVLLCYFTKLRFDDTMLDACSQIMSALEAVPVRDPAFEQMKKDIMSYTKKNANDIVTRVQMRARGLDGGVLPLQK